MPDRSENALAKFAVEKAGENYLIHVESEAGESIELTATSEQLELLADTLDEVLGAEDSGTAEEDLPEE